MLKETKLKIKDDLDLKNLESLGFIKQDNGEYRYTDDESHECIGIFGERKIVYFEYEKPISTLSEYIIENVLGILFDMIQKGWVEKTK